MDRKHKFKEIKNYALYYGKGCLEELSKFDLVIVEPLMHNNESVKYLKEKNTLVIAYVSILEINSSSEIFHLLKREDFLIYNAEKKMNIEYNNYIMDLRSKRWNSLLINNIGNLIANKKYDGIFIDTIADIEHFELGVNIKNSLINAYINFLKCFKELFPSSLIIQNNGIQQIINFSVNLIDGLMLENPNLNQNNVNLVKNMVYLKEKYNVNIFILLEDGNYVKSDYLNGILKFQDVNKFLIYEAPYRYIGKVNIPTY